MMSEKEPGARSPKVPANVPVVVAFEIPVAVFVAICCKLFAVPERVPVYVLRKDLVVT